MTTATTKRSALAAALSRVPLRGARIVLDAGLDHLVEDEARALVDAASRKDSAEESLLLACSKHGVSQLDLFASRIEERVPSAALAECRDRAIDLRQATASTDAARMLLERAVGQVLASDDAREYVRDLANTMEVRLDAISTEVSDIARTLMLLANALVESPDLRTSQNKWKPATASTFISTDALAALRNDVARLGRI